MDFGQFNLTGYRAPGTPAYRLYDEAVEQVRAAEAAGFGVSWFAEHHFSNYCAGGSSLAAALRSIERFAAEVRPLLEREMGPLDRIGLAEAA